MSASGRVRETSIVNEKLNIESKPYGKFSKGTAPGGKKPRILFPEGKRERKETQAWDTAEMRRIDSRNYWDEIIIHT